MSKPDVEDLELVRQLIEADGINADHTPNQLRKIRRLIFRAAVDSYMDRRSISIPGLRCYRITMEPSSQPELPRRCAAEGRN